MAEGKTPGKKVKITIKNLAGETTREVSESELKMIKGGASCHPILGESCKRLKVIIAKSGAKADLLIVVMR